VVSKILKFKCKIKIETTDIRYDCDINDLDEAISTLLRFKEVQNVTFRSPQRSLEEVDQYILNLKGTGLFTVRDIVSRLSVGPAAVRGSIKRLIKSKRVKETRKGKGCVPSRYMLVGRDV